MRISILTILVALVAGCGAHQDYVSRHSDTMSENDGWGSERIANLERAARYPWIDDGVCAVRWASSEWKTLVEKCYYSLDLSRIRFQDLEHRCKVANTDAASVQAMVGMCLLVQPELVVGVVAIVGLVVVGAAIVAELQKLPCKCMCMGIDALGKRHGPYQIDPTKNKRACERACLQARYEGGGFCR